MDDEVNNLFNIEISDEEEETKPSRRTDQNEEEFQAVQTTYRPKVEDGEIHKTIELPLPPDAHKYQLQELLHAVEELYFFRRFSEALDFISRVRTTDCNNAINDETRVTLEFYEKRCQQKLTSNEDP